MFTGIILPKCSNFCKHNHTMYCKFKVQFQLFHNLSQKFLILNGTDSETIKLEFLVSKPGKDRKNVQVSMTDDVAN